MAGASYKIKMFYTNHQIHSSGSKHKHPIPESALVKWFVIKVKCVKTWIWSLTESLVEAKNLFTMMKY